MNQHTADLIEAIENHPAIDPLNKPEYSTLAAAYAELQEMALELVAYAKKTSVALQSIDTLAKETKMRAGSVIRAIIDDLNQPPKGNIGTPWVCKTTTAEELIANKTVTVEQNGDVTITGTINQPKS